MAKKKRKTAKRTVRQASRGTWADPDARKSVAAELNDLARLAGLKRTKKVEIETALVDLKSRVWAMADE